MTITVDRTLRVAIFDRRFEPAVDTLWTLPYKARSRIAAADRLRAHSRCAGVAQLVEQLICNQ